MLLRAEKGSAFMSKSNNNQPSYQDKKNGNPTNSNNMPDFSNKKNNGNPTNSNMPDFSNKKSNN